MANQALELTLGGTSFKLVEGAEAMRVVWVREEAQVNEVLDVDFTALRSRRDNRLMVQTDWSDGISTVVPRMSAETVGLFSMSKNMDTVTRPGSLLPIHEWSEANDTNMEDQVPLIDTPDGVFIIGNTVVEDATNKDIYQLQAAGTWSRVTGVTSGQALDSIYDQAYDGTTKNIYVVNGSAVAYYHPTATKAQGSVISYTREGPTNLAIHNGRLLLYNGDTVREILDPTGTPSFSAVYNDGMGSDYLKDMVSTSDEVVNQTTIDLMTATSEGVYYVKNVVGPNGIPVPWVFRIDRNSAGSDIGTPIATLPEGTVALDVAWHLGSLVIATTNRYAAVLTNKLVNGEWPVTYYHVTGNNIGTLGIPLIPTTSNHAVQPNLDETVASILGSAGELLFLGGRRRIWIYDAVRGGLHPWITLTTAGNHGVLHSMATYQDSANDLAYLWGGVASTSGAGKWRYVTQKAHNAGLYPQADGGEIYELESVLFDFQLPAERKRIVSWTLDLDQVGSEGQWKLYISVDDGAWNLVSTITAASNPIETDLTAVDDANVTGYRFQYKLAYEALDAGTPRQPVVRGVSIEAVAGRMVPVYFFNVDLGESVIENQVLDPTTQYNALEALASSADDQAMTVLFGESNDTLISETVKVENVEVVTTNENELRAQVLVRRAVSE